MAVTKHNPIPKTPKTKTTTVDCGGARYDRIVLYRLHSHTLRLPNHVSPMLREFFAAWWDAYATDGKPENREQRAAILSLAAARRAGAEADRARAWRLIDWKVRVEAAALLELAGFRAHAEAYRALPEITGPELPRGAVRVFRRAYLDTDKASTLSMAKRRREGRADAPRWRARAGYGDLAALRRAALTVFRDIAAMLKEDVPSRMTPLGLGLLAAGYARIVVDCEPRITRAAIRRATASLEASARALLADVLGVQAQKRAAA